MPTLAKVRTDVSGGFLSPVAGTPRLSQEYGRPNKSYAAGHHTGLDYAVPAGTAVMTVGSGTVVESGFNKSYGNYIKVKHANGLYSLYAHLSNRTVSAGQTVREGAIIGKSGNTGNSTGAHLHFEIRGGSGSYNDAIDPYRYFNAAAQSVVNKGLKAVGVAPRPVTGSAAATAAAVGSAVSKAVSGGGGGGGGGGTSKSTYSSGGGGGAGGGSVSEKPLTAQDFGFSSAFLAANPEINNLVNEAIKNQWTNAQLQGRVIDTAWYRARTAAQREYDQASIADPAEYAERERKMLEDLTRLAKVMGVSTANLETEAKNAVRNGLTADDYIGFLSVRANYSAEQVGRAGMVQQQVLEYANAYGVTTGPDEMNRLMRDALSAGSEWSTILQGQEDMFRERAKAMYSGVAAQIDAGATVKGILNPYLSRAAQMLGTPVEQMDPANGTWNRAITGAVPLTMQEWETQVRKDPTYRWDRGPQALEWARGVGDEFMKAFGART